MGLDISIRTDQDERILQAIHSDDSISLRETLSRRFLPLIFRQHEPNDEELSQISAITGIDLTPLLDMGLYPDPLDEEYQLSQCDTEEEKQKAIDKINTNKQKYAKPVREVIDILEQLDASLKAKPEYYKQLELSDTSDDSLRYFKNYSVDPAPNSYGFISHSDTTFGVDIRTMSKYLKFAETKGAAITYFSFR
jgi:hypothetical protein